MTSRKKVLELVMEKLKDDLKDYSRPITYQDDDYYTKYAAKADYIEDLIYFINIVSTS